jgi:hypothetical protein
MWNCFALYCVALHTASSNLPHTSDRLHFAGHQLRFRDGF